jgi:hypothetical protein
VIEINCKACGRPFAPRRGRQFCDHVGRQRNRFPAVYRFICPDGRSYVGAVGDCRNRGDIRRSNPRLLAAFDLHPPTTCTFEVLERLTPGCSAEALRVAEQQDINRLRSELPAVRL